MVTEQVVRHVEIQRAPPGKHRVIIQNSTGVKKILDKDTYNEATSAAKTNEIPDTKAFVVDEEGSCLIFF
jgi:hypothetical protein